jgi:hypothetical protein
MARNGGMTVVLAAVQQRTAPLIIFHVSNLVFGNGIVRGTTVAFMLKN